MTMVEQVIEAARRHLADGWNPIPLPAGAKWPPPAGVTGWNGRSVTAADLERTDWDWSGNLGLRLPPGVIGIDVDAYAGGTLDPFEEAYGPLPATRWSTSRDDGSGIAYFRVPVGISFATDPAPGIDIIQTHHRYGVCWPSIHPKTGRPYNWIDEEEPDEECLGPGPVEDLPELPWPWVEALRVAKQPGVDAATPEAARTFTAEHAASERPAALKGVLTKLEGVTAGGRHDALTKAACWAMREAAAGLYSADKAIAALEGWWVSVMDDERRRNGGEFGSVILWAIGQANTDPARIEAIKAARQERRQPPPGIDPETGEIVAPQAARGLDDSFWQSRRELAHIHQAAKARLVAPAALLGAVLARLAAFTPPSTCIPAIVGGAAPLSTFVALRGGSGAGKSSAMSAAADLLPVTPAGCVGPLALGSGEGLVEAFMELVEEEGGDGKKRRVKRQVHHGGLFSLDEGQALNEIGSRKGSTILPVLRTAWSGGDPGQANASVETRRSLAPGSYAMGLISAWQDHVAAALIADEAGGTPQRFLWLPTDDPGATVETPPWPGPLDVTLPPKIAHAGKVLPAPLEVAPCILGEIRAARVERLRTGADPGLDSHRFLAKLKVAGCLAVLDGRRDIGPEDWRLAESIMTTSDGVRAWIVSESRRQREGVEMAGHQRAVRREEIVEEASHRRAVSSMARSIARVVHREKRAARRDLHAATASKHRAVASLDEAIVEAERLHWIVVEGIGSAAIFTPGEARPT